MSSLRIKVDSCNDTEQEHCTDAMQWNALSICDSFCDCAKYKKCSAMLANVSASIAVVQFNAKDCSALLAKVLWLPPITAHCFRPQWATPDQLVLQCHPMHRAVRCINNLVCSVQGKCIGMCLVLTAVRLGAVCAGALVAVSDDQRGFN